MKRLRVLFPCVLALNVAGCASVVKGTSQSIAINSAPEQGATCTLQNAEGTWTVTTPGAVTVPRSKHDISVNCLKEGDMKGAGVLQSGTQMMTAGNLLLGGVIGLGVDAATGAMNDYPANITIQLIRQEAVKPVSVQPEDSKKSVPTS